MTPAPRKRPLIASSDHSSACSQYAATLNFVLGLAKLNRKRKIEVYAQVPFLTLKDMNMLTRAGIKVVNPFPQEGEYARLDQNGCVFSVHLNCGGHIEVMTLEYTRPALITWSDGQHHRALGHPTRRAELAGLGWEYDRVQEIDALDPPDEYDQGVESMDDVDMTDPPSGSLSTPPSSKKRSIDNDYVPNTPLQKRRSLSGSFSGSPSGKKRSIDDHDHDVPGTPPPKRRSPPDLSPDLFLNLSSHLSPHLSGKKRSVDDEATPESPPRKAHSLSGLLSEYVPPAVPRSRSRKRRSTDEVPDTPLQKRRCPSEPLFGSASGKKRVHGETISEDDGYVPERPPSAPKRVQQSPRNITVHDRLMFPASMNQRCDSRRTKTTMQHHRSARSAHIMVE
ncbi:hypothetical protein DL769_005624 [Monosporascus sp. CRB-8-3]|nr:hypothetical protein DL769_005624 [Monosporascus sp. CRB-8-3]